MICKAGTLLATSFGSLEGSPPPQQSDGHIKSRHHHRYSTRPDFLCIDVSRITCLLVPTKEMYAYAVQASLGDDVHSADQSTKTMESHIAQIAGKEAALFIPSGTMSNQLAIRTHLKQP